MSDNNEKILPAYLAEGEAIISEEMKEKYQDYANSLINDVSEPEVTEAVTNDIANDPEPVAEPIEIIDSLVTEATAEVNDTLITAKSKSKKNPIAQVLGAVKNGTIGTTTKDKSKEESKRISVAPAKKEEEKVAVYSTKSARWGGVGDISRGYNILPKDKADIWLKRNHVRLATPQEIEREFGS